MEWAEFDAVEPIGGLRADWQAAAVCSAVMNAAAMMSGSRRRTTPKDWLLKFAKEGTKQGTSKPAGVTPQEMKFKAMLAFAAFQSENRRGRRK